MGGLGVSYRCIWARPPDPARRTQLWIKATGGWPWFEKDDGSYLQWNESDGEWRCFQEDMTPNYTYRALQWQGGLTYQEIEAGLPPTRWSRVYGPESDSSPSSPDSPTYSGYSGVGIGDRGFLGRKRKRRNPMRNRLTLRWSAACIRLL